MRGARLMVSSLPSLALLLEPGSPDLRPEDQDLSHPTPPPALDQHFPGVITPSCINELLPCGRRQSCCRRVRGLLWGQTWSSHGVRPSCNAVTSTSRIRGSASSWEHL